MSPSERRDMREQLGRTVQPIMLSLSDGVSEMLGVPVDDDGGEQVQTYHAEVLPFGRAVTDFALASNAQGVLQRVMCLALVEADLGATLHIGIEQPVDDEKCPLDPSDLSQGQAV